MTEITMSDALLQRDAAIAAVDAHADAAWKAQALDAVLVTCRSYPEFHSDRIWETGLDEPSEARALGPVMLQAARFGWCVRTDRVAPSVRSHGSPKPVWRSLLFEPSFGDGQLFATPPADPASAITGEAA